MNFTRKTYVEYPGSPRKEVSSRNPAEIGLPDGEYGFRFYDVIIAPFHIDGQTMELRSDAFNFSPWYFRGGQIYTAQELEDLLPDRKDILAIYMEVNQFDRAFYIDGELFAYLQPADIWLGTTI